QLFFFKDTRFFVLLNSAKVNVQKVILSSKTPPSLRATSSINRGETGDFCRRQGVFQLSLCL
ncbi:hypothetical protein, partial [Butyricimonas faecihominis]|uniref:hypothetical protein n=1 Tax=Butyricimonas faecihominis TaxID=1472416 RepID=UPI0032C17544